MNGHCPFGGHFAPDGPSGPIPSLGTPRVLGTPSKMKLDPRARTLAWNHFQTYPNVEKCRNLNEIVGIVSFHSKQLAKILKMPGRSVVRLPLANIWDPRIFTTKGHPHTNTYT